MTTLWTGTLNLVQLEAIEQVVAAGGVCVPLSYPWRGVRQSAPTTLTLSSSPGPQPSSVQAAGLLHLASESSSWHRLSWIEPPLGSRSLTLDLASDIHIFFTFQPTPPEQ